MRKLVDEDVVERCIERFLEYADGSRSPSSGMKLMRDVMVAKGAVDPRSQVHGINKLLNFESDPELMCYVRLPSIVDAVRDLIGNDIYSIVTNVFNKPPEVDGRHPLHQDLRHFRIRPAEKIIAVWTALCPMNRENGCLAVVPGSHLGGLLEHETPDWEYVNYKFYGVTDKLLDKRLHIEMQPGDTIFFSPLLVHGSGRNRTQDFRRSISAHYVSAECWSTGSDWRQNEFVVPIT